MSNKPDFLNFSLSNILSGDQFSLFNARVRLLYYGLALAFFTSFVLLLGVLHQGHVLLATVCGIMLGASAVLFKFLTYRPNLRLISHIILVVGTLANIFNIYVIIQNIDIVTVSVLMLIMLFSITMLGQRIGLIYAAINVLAAVGLLILLSNNSYLIDLKPEKVDQSTLVISLFSCFILIVFIQSHFQTAFVKTIKQLRTTTNEKITLTDDFKKAIDKAEKSSEAKSEFLSTMSHEIRTPLNAVIGMSNLLIMGGPRPDQKENLDILKFSAGNLLSIVNDVLDFNKIESGKLIFENIKLNLVDLMQSICGGQLISAREKGLNFKLDVDSALARKVVYGDPTRITQIVFNLVSNAIKFTSEGNIWVKASCIEDRHNFITVNFSVKDTGIGIPKERMDIIFEPFIQESISTTRQYGGTGLGLAIVKRLLELQGLKIKVKSTVGQGSEFSFSMEFPVSTEIVPETIKKPAEAIEQTAETLSTLRVLIAEDNPVNVMLMKKLLSKWNISPSIAENGERAVEFVQYGNFDIILMDLQMPVMNGFDAAAEIRRMPDPKKAAIPIIALTASALFDIKEKVYESGMNDYVSKPFKPDELFEKIHNLVPSLQDV